MKFQVVTHPEATNDAILVQGTLPIGSRRFVVDSLRELKRILSEDAAQKRERIVRGTDIMVICCGPLKAFYQVKIEKNKSIVIIRKFVRNEKWEPPAPASPVAS
jgi:hypothetical protein